MDCGLVIPTFFYECFSFLLGLFDPELLPGGIDYGVGTGSEILSSHLGSRANSDDVGSVDTHHGVVRRVEED